MTIEVTSDSSGSTETSTYDMNLLCDENAVATPWVPIAVDLGELEGQSVEVECGEERAFTATVTGMIDEGATFEYDWTVFGGSNDDTAAIIDGGTSTQWIGTSYWEVTDTETFVLRCGTIQDDGNCSVVDANGIVLDKAHAEIYFQANNKGSGEVARNAVPVDLYCLPPPPPLSTQAPTSKPVVFELTTYIGNVDCGKRLMNKKEAAKYCAVLEGELEGIGNSVVCKVVKQKCVLPGGGRALGSSSSTLHRQLALGRLQVVTKLTVTGTSKSNAKTKKSATRIPKKNQGALTKGTRGISSYFNKAVFDTAAGSSRVSCAARITACNVM